MVDLPRPAPLRAGPSRGAIAAAFVVLAVFPLAGQAAPAESQVMQGSPPIVAATPASAQAGKPPRPTTEGPALPAAAQLSWWYNPPILLTAALSGVIGLGGTALALCFGWLNTRRTLDVARATSEATINQKANEAELSAIQIKLDTFYGPYLQRSGENELLARELRGGRPSGYRMLLSLVDPAWYGGLSKADATIVAEVVANGLELRTMIRERAGAVDPAVLPYLERAGSHFTLLHLAKQGALDGDPERFRRFAYPRQLDPVLRIDMERLRARAALLRSAPFARHEAAPRLAIPSEHALEP